MLIYLRVGKKRQKHFSRCCDHLHLNALFSFQLTDERDWAIETLQNVNQQCQIEIVYNITIWVVVGGDLVPPEDVFGAICPADCSGNGKCNDGTY